MAQNVKPNKDAMYDRIMGIDLTGIKSICANGTALETGILDSHSFLRSRNGAKLQYSSIVSFPTSINEFYIASRKLVDHR